MSTHVILMPANDGPTLGYQAALVKEYECEWTGETVRDVLRHGPWSDAMLIARTRGIDWAAKNGYRLAPGY